MNLQFATFAKLKAFRNRYQLPGQHNFTEILITSNCIYPPETINQCCNSRIPPNNESPRILPIRCNVNTQKKLWFVNTGRLGGMYWI